MCEPFVTRQISVRPRGASGMSQERVPAFPRGGLPELLPLHKQPVS